MEVKLTGRAAIKRPVFTQTALSQAVDGEGGEREEGGDEMAKEEEAESLDRLQDGPENSEDAFR